MQTFNRIEGVPAPIGPYSIAVKVGNLLFCAGQIGVDPKTNTLVEGGIKEQTEQVLKNLEAVLTGAGSSPERIAMTTIFLTEMSHGKVVNELYSAFVDLDSPPARQTVAVKELPAGALVEISLIANTI